MRDLFNRIQNWIDAGLPMTNVQRGLIVLGFIFCLLIYFVVQQDEQKLPSPCDAEAFPARCYYIDEDICHAIWDKSKVTCADYVKTLSLPPGRLTAPIEFKCQQINLDRAFAQSRKSTPECVQMAQDLEDWKKRNDFHQ